MLRSIPFHPNMTLAFSHIAMHASSTQSVNIPEIFNAYQYIIFKLDFCPNNFHIFRFSRSGKGEVDVYHFLSKKSSDVYVLFFPALVTAHHPCVIMHEVNACQPRSQGLSLPAPLGTRLNACRDR